MTYKLGSVFDKKEAFNFVFEKDAITFLLNAKLKISFLKKLGIENELTESLFNL